MENLIIEVKAMFANSEKDKHKFDRLRRDIDPKAQSERAPEPPQEPEPIPVDSTARGGAFTPDQMNELRRMDRLTRVQNPNAVFLWERTPAIAPGDWLELSNHESSAIFYPANALTVTAGTPGASVLADLQVLHDGNTYVINEVAAAPGIDLRLTFNNVTSLNRFMVMAYYHGTTTHTIEIQLYNNDTAAWDTFDTLTHDVSNNPTMKQFFGAVPDDTDYIADGTVLMRFYHAVMGNQNHYLDIDYAALAGGARINANTGGFVPHRNGFTAGCSIETDNQLTANTGMTFRLYRNGVASRFEFTVTSGDNSGSGAVRARPYNTNPGIYKDDPENEVFPFRAQERLAFRAEAPALQGISTSVDLTSFKLFPFWVYETMSPDAEEAMGTGARAAISGGGSGTGEVGDGGNGNGGGILE
jgi:hypothetical protein